MSYSDITFNKENLNFYLNELAKEFRKRNGKIIPAELVLIGGASVLANYGFRDMTHDMDAVIIASSAMKEAINYVGERYGLPNGWLNAEFMKTKSYSLKLVEHSVYYKTFSNVLTVRTIAGEYLIAMKLMSGRKYKNDLSDIIGILMWHEKQGTPIEYEQVEKAVIDLYGSFKRIPEESRLFIAEALKNKEYKRVYETIRNEEEKNKSIVLGVEQDYPGAASEESIEKILKAAKKKLEQK